MRLDERFLEFALLGSSWVLWLLVGLSVTAVTVAVERSLAYRKTMSEQQRLRSLLLAQWATVTNGRSTTREALDVIERQRTASTGPAARMVAAMLRAVPSGRDAVRSISLACRARERVALEGPLPLLGTIGANAPFVGLFGTVLDILGVFHFLGQQELGAGANTNAIMAGLSQALVATAMGLLVAIPAVALYNALLRRQDAIVTVLDEISDLATAFIVAHGGTDGDGLER